MGVAAPACRDGAPEGPPSLDELKLGDAVKESGTLLMSLPNGMHRLDNQGAPRSEIVIGVHGYESAGYEWVYPLKKLGESKSRVYFYRWDWRQCPEQAASTLDRAIAALIGDAPDARRVRVFAHSYGGVVAAVMGARHSGDVPLELNLIASPLAGYPHLSARCSYRGTDELALNEHVTLRQWRTRKELDGAYRGLPTDPQVANLPGEVTLLPETYRGERLGHNWSISWVADAVSRES